jgi:hypothetical protein
MSIIGPARRELYRLLVQGPESNSSRLFNGAGRDAQSGVDSDRPPGGERRIRFGP